MHHLPGMLSWETASGREFRGTAIQIGVDWKQVNNRAVTGPKTGVITGEITGRFRAGVNRGQELKSCKTSPSVLELGFGYACTLLGLYRSRVSRAGPAARQSVGSYANVSVS